MDEETGKDSKDVLTDFLSSKIGKALYDKETRMSSIFYGEIKEERLNSWSENENPYDILKENNRINRLSGWDFLEVTKKLFTDEVRVDWGSFAYKCTKDQLRKLMQKTHCEIEKIDQMDPDQIYGIVFIEES